MFLRNFSIEQLEHYVFELQTTAEKYFKQDRVREYLTIVHRNQGGDIALGVMAYIVIVLGKYTQMMAAYNIQRQNTDAVVELYEWFNSRFQQFTTLFRSEIVVLCSVNICQQTLLAFLFFRNLLKDMTHCQLSMSSAGT